MAFAKLILVYKNNKFLGRKFPDEPKELVIKNLIFNATKVNY